MIKKVCAEFGIKGDYLGYEVLKSGNINNTYKVVFFRDGEEKTYIIQRINTYVFKNPENVMHNISLVTEYIRKKIKETGKSAKRNVLHYLTASDDKNYYVDPSGGFWRGYRFIDNSITYDENNNPRILLAAGKAFGEFQMYLSDFDAKSLKEIIPDFHNTPKRLDDFFKAVDSDPLNRVKDIKEEIDFIIENKDIACRLYKLLEEEKLPLRVTHNDTKCNNVLFDEDTGEHLAVIDLDTIMPGLVAYDFGDAIRFAANRSKEDETDLSKVCLDTNLFENFTKGFMSKMGKMLCDCEINNLALGPITMAIELASRFALDYLTGDKYFKTDHPGHNVERTKCQIALAKDMILKFDEMNKIIKKYV